MATKEKKSGCFSIIFKGFGALVLLSIVLGIIGAFTTKNHERQTERVERPKVSADIEGPRPPKPVAKQATETPLDLATVTSAEMPKDLKVKTAFTAKSPSGSVTVPAGASVKFIALSGDTLTIDFAGARGNTTIGATDLRERVLEKRRLVKEAEKARAEAERQVAEKAAQAEAEAKAIREANFKKLIDELGKKPEPIPANFSNSQKKPPAVIRSLLEKTAKNPASIEYIDVFPAIVTDYKGQKCWGMKFTFRAKNSFGGYVINTAFAYIFRDQVIGFVNEDGM